MPLNKPPEIAVLLDALTQAQQMLRSINRRPAAADRALKQVDRALLVVQHMVDAVK